ncbi:phosphotransferase enzyme family protein-like protein [Aspergillus tubingensis]|uniref:phosphotransferase enzyme family protein-like protein n=1 Tax=Aspergillus tubingensis TaxID=5068 RepID=UPI001578627B|nr:phosphotransferase enzyme family protein-like protein [Aspergillus tubingensis]GFN17923.1 phosphotransferase enzyme family protein-like protein [Aspergillus tubingensis]
MEQFLRALARVEHEVEYKRPGHLALSARMRDSWSAGRFWFDYAARKSFDVDVVYWDTLHSAGTGIEELDEEARVELELFKRLKMEQLKAYKEECLVRFCSDI